MKKFSEFVVRFKYLFFGLFAAALTASLILLPKVKANYDISSYLPSDMETRQALTIIEDEFGMNATVNVMIKGIEPTEAQTLAKKLGAVENVQLASFDSASEKHYKDGNALIKLTVKGGDFSDSAQGALAAVEKTLKADGYTYYTSGSAVDSARMQNGIGGEMTLIMIISVIVVVAILLMSSRSWFEPIVFLLVIGVAILINLGTNAVFGQISYITKSVAAILQLALAMDYSIVLLHNFDSFAEKGDGAAEAAAKALAVSIKPIISSSLTTVAGLVALMFMSFGIGLDIGLVMSKGIIISMLTVFFMMPGLLVIFHKPLAKLRHKPLPLGGTKLASGVVKARFVLPIVLVTLIAVGAVLQSFNTYSFSEYQPSVDRDEIEAVFAPESSMIIILPKAENETDYELQSAAVENISRIKKNGETPFVSAQTFESTVDSVCESVLDEMGVKDWLRPLMRPSVRAEVEKNEQIYALFNGSHHSRIIISFDLPQADASTFRYIDEIKSELDLLFGVGNSFMAGGVMTNYDISKAFDKDLFITNLISTIAILLIIGLTFRSFSLPIVLVLIIQGAIWAAMSVSFIMQSPIFFMSYLIASAILMGATIDYAILITDRYTKARKSMGKLDSLKDALSGSMPTVLTSGLILTIAGFIVGGISSSTAISTIGMLLGRGALAAMVLVLVLLPELLYILDKPIEKTSFKMEFSPDKLLKQKSSADNN